MRAYVKFPDKADHWAIDADFARATGASSPKAAPSVAWMPMGENQTTKTDCTFGMMPSQFPIGHSARESDNPNILCIVRALRRATAFTRPNRFDNSSARHPALQKLPQHPLSVPRSATIPGQFLTIGGYSVRIRSFASSDLLSASAEILPV